MAAAVPIYGRYDWFTDTGNGRPEFIKVLERFIVKLPFTTNRQVYLDASPIDPGARRCATVLHPARHAMTR